MNNAIENIEFNQNKVQANLLQLLAWMKSESAQIQVQGHTLSEAEIARVRKLDRAILLLDEIIELLSSPDQQNFAEAITTPSVNGQQKLAFEEVFAVLKTNLTKLESIKGVISVRPGYHMVDNNFTETPAIVVAVSPRLILEKDASLLEIPSQLGNVPVDVVAATPAEQLQFRQNVFSTHTGMMSSTNFSASEIAQWEEIVGLTSPLELTAFAVSPFADSLVTYTPPAGLTLERRTVDKMTCHVSPDTGWKLLSEFLAGVTERFTIAMYDFKADYIEEVLQKSVQQTQSDLNLIMHFDNDQKEKLFNELLRNALPGKFDSVWASNKKNALFKTSYHTKVAVRDGKDFWLSSGNWTRTSQPDVGQNPFPGDLYTKGNREWHVIVEDREMAEMFENYIKFDISESKNLPEPQALPALPDLLIPIESFTAEAFTIQQPFIFQPETFEQVDVQPLLTPDNYIDQIIELINSAQVTLYLQFSYIYYPAQNDKFRQLIRAIKNRIDNQVEVRIIVSNYQELSDSSKLIAFGIPNSCLRQQKSKLHNKGILVDSEKVVVGSHNWSPAGTLKNRDASLIIYDARVTKYFESIFLWDWENNTKPIAAPQPTPMIAEDLTTPTGMVRVAWRTYFE